MSALTLMEELKLARPDLQWRRGMGGIYDALLPDGRRMQAWMVGETYAVSVGRGMAVRAFDLPELIERVIAPKPEPEPVVQRVGGGVVVGNPGGGGR